MAKIYQGGNTNLYIIEEQTTRFWLPPWYLLAIVFSVLQWYTDSDYPLVFFCHCVVYSSMIYRFWLPPSVYHRRTDNTMAKWYQGGNHNLYIIEEQTTKWPKDTVSFGHFVVCSSMIYRLWLPPWYLLAIVLSVLLWYTDSAYPLGIFWPLCCLFWG
jgi:hypothetical protein